MTPEDRKTIAQHIGNEVTQRLRYLAKNAPESWDGIELRWALQDISEDFVSPALSKRSSRYKSYRQNFLALMRSR